MSVLSLFSNDGMFQLKHNMVATRLATIVTDTQTLDNLLVTASLNVNNKELDEVNDSMQKHKIHTVFTLYECRNNVHSRLS